MLNWGTFPIREIKEEELLKLLDKVGLKNKIDSLSDGVEHVLGKLEKDGQDLSGGEWQKLAILRAMCSRTCLIAGRAGFCAGSGKAKGIYIICF